MAGTRSALRRRGLAPLAGLLLLLALPCRAGCCDEADSTGFTPRWERAAAVIEAWVESGASGDLSPESEAVDVWVIADACLASGLPESLARIAPVPEPDRLAWERYVVTSAARDPQSAVRAALKEALVALRGQRAEQALETLAALRPREQTVLASYVSEARALAQREAGRIPQAVTELKEAARAAETIEWSYGRALMLHEAAGLTRAFVGDLPAARDLWRDAAAALADGPSVRLRGDVLNGWGSAAADLGDHDRAVECFRRAATTFESIGRPIEQAISLANLGLVWCRLGRFSTALDVLDRARSVLGAREPGPEEEAAHLDASAQCRVWEGVTRGAMGRHDEALRLHRRTVAELEAARSPGWTYRYALANLGDSAFELGDTVTARDALERAESLFHEAGDPVQAAMTRGARGHLLASDTSSVEGLHLIQSAERVLRSEGHAIPACELRLTLADALADRGYLGLAALLHRAGLAETTVLGAVGLLARHSEGLARCYLRAGRWEPALAAALEGLAPVEDIHRGLADEESIGVGMQVSGLFETGAAAAARLDRAADLATFLESGRAGALRTALNSIGSAPGTGITDEVQRALGEARLREFHAHGAWLEALAAGVTHSGREPIRRELEDAREDVRAAITRIQRMERLRTNLMYPRADTVEELRAVLADDEALVLLSLPAGSDISQGYALVVEKSRLRVVGLGTSAAIRAAASSLCTNCADPTVAEEATTLIDLLVRPLGLDPSVRRVLVSPDGELAYLPVGLLFQGREVVLVPSGTVFGILRSEAKKGRGRDAPSRVVGFGDPDYSRKVGGIAQDRLPYSLHLGALPGSRREVEAVADVKFLGPRATEANLRESLKGVKPGERLRALLLAGHGLVNEDHPSLSAIALTADGEDDGFLTALEILQLRIPADLVVLSACQSGRGTDAPGEGILGLVRAFMFAGAPRVLASLWKVDDEATAVLMTHFFRRLEAKDAPAQALRAAQEHVRGAKPKWADPYYWAGWVLWGLPD